MNKKEQAELERAHTFAALRWTVPVVRNVGIPEVFVNVSEGWDFNAYSVRVWEGWSRIASHGAGTKLKDGYQSGTQGGRMMFSTKALALSAMRHEMEWEFAKALRCVDKQIAAES